MSLFGIATRLYLLIGLSLLLVAGVMIFTLRDTASGLEDERRSLLLTVDEVALSLIEQKYSLETSGALSRAEAQRSALD